MIVLVCGGRDYKDWERFRDVMDKLHEEHVFRKVIYGDAAGADHMAGLWAHRWKISHSQYKAFWGTQGRAAGPLRNKRMLYEGKPDLVVAFPGGDGTANMMKQAKAAGVVIFRVEK